MQNAKNILQKIHLSYGVHTNKELALRLNIAQGSVDSWTSRNKIPDKYLTKCVEDTGVSLDWLLSEDKPTFHISGGTKNISQVNGGVGIQETTSTDEDEINNIDKGTLILFKEAYEKAKNNNEINRLRLYLMEYN